MGCWFNTFPDRFLSISRTHSIMKPITSANI